LGQKENSAAFVLWCVDSENLSPSSPLFRDERIGLTLVSFFFEVKQIGIASLLRVSVFSEFVISEMDLRLKDFPVKVLLCVFTVVV